VDLIGALIGAAGKGLRHVRLAVMRIDDARVEGTAIYRGDALEKAERRRCVANGCGLTCDAWRSYR
jgi:hypothetical protein